MSEIIQGYSTAFKGLIKNPELECVESTIPVLGLGICIYDSEDYAKEKAEEIARNSLLIRAHIQGVDFFTDRIQETNVVCIGIDHCENYAAAHSEAVLGHIGRFKSSEQQLEKRLHQLEIAKALLENIGEVSGDLYVRLRNLIAKREKLLH